MRMTTISNGPKQIISTSGGLELFTKIEISRQLGKRMKHSLQGCGTSPKQAFEKP